MRDAVDPLRQYRSNDLECAHCDARIEAARLIAESHHRVADSIDRALVDAAPLMGAVTESLLCANSLGRFMRKWTIPAFFMLILSGAVTPDMAKGFHTLLKMAGAMQ